MICPNEDCQIGMVSLFRTIDGRVTPVFEVCPTCQGIGYTCSYCGGNPVHCGCDDDDKGIPRVIRDRPSNGGNIR